MTADEPLGSSGLKPDTSTVRCHDSIVHTNCVLKGVALTLITTFKPICITLTHAFVTLVLRAIFRI